jgi:hypothetical protein
MPKPRDQEFECLGYPVIKELHNSVRIVGYHVCPCGKKHSNDALRKLLNRVQAQE